ncbi:pentapeptide repeats (9 copies) [Rhodobiaceae bacterium]|nr:pentapeptide repeats (9 copies) [Rhodobiaceae bacterium]
MSESNALDRLVEVADRHFCPYHLPHSAKTQGETYGRSTPTLIPNRKENWSSADIEVFNNDILERIETALKNGTHCDLSGVVFPGSFSCADRALPEIDFSHCRFERGNVDFSGAEFSGNTASFSSAVFSCVDVSFKDTLFTSKRAEFYETVFRCLDVWFAGADFSDCYAAFSGSNFDCNHVDFLGASFTGGDNFQRTKFSGTSTSFSNSQFTGGDFSLAEFGSDETYFDRAEFLDGYPTFENAKFFGHKVDFSNSAFCTTVSFAASPRKKADIRELAFGELNFNNANFASRVSFSNRVFLAATSFKNTGFARAPEFHGCELHQNTAFPSIGSFRDTSYKGAATAYRTLRLAMKQQEAHEEEAMFWALEQISKRNDLECNPLNNWKNLFNWIPWSLSAVYALLSNYGLSINRPLVALTVWLFGATPIFYFCLRSNVDKLFGSTTYSDLLGFSIAQSLRPFFIWGDYNGSGIRSVLGENVNVLSVKLFATADSLISLVLIALLILAVRRRFRMQ